MAFERGPENVSAPDSTVTVPGLFALTPAADVQYSRANDAFEIDWTPFDLHQLVSWLVDVACVIALGEDIGRLACASTLTAAFFAPLVSTWATCKPAVAAAMRPPSAVIQVRPFENLADGSCFPDPPLHLGPIRQEGKLSFAGPLWARMNEAAWRCSDRSSNYLILSTTVDANGTIGATSGAGAFGGCGGSFKPTKPSARPCRTATRL